MLSSAMNNSPPVNIGKHGTSKEGRVISSHLKLFKDRLLLKIRFNALTSKPLYSCVTP